MAWEGPSREFLAALERAGAERADDGRFLTAVPALPKPPGQGSVLCYSKLEVRDSDSVLCVPGSLMVKVGDDWTFAEELVHAVPHGGEPCE